MYHRFVRGWNSCGYHYIVMHDGTVEKCRPEQTVGAHVRGSNLDSLGIAWAGQGTPTDKQYTKLVQLTVDVLKRLKLTVMNVFGHSHFNKGKTCPDIDMFDFEMDIIRRWYD